MKYFYNKWQQIANKEEKFNRCINKKGGQEDALAAKQILNLKNY